MDYFAMYDRTLKEFKASLEWKGGLNWQGLQWAGDMYYELQILEEIIMELGRS